MARRASVTILFLGAAAMGCSESVSPSAPPQPTGIAAVAYAADGRPAPEAFNTEAYDRIEDNRFLSAQKAPLSTFGVDVDTASYSNVRRFLLDEHRLPPKDSVRIEEMINYFHYDYAQPAGNAPFSVAADVATCPWEPAHRLVRVALQGRSIAEEQTPPRNLVFLVDVSGSMNEPKKLPLVKGALAMLAQKLRADDTISIVVYAGTEGLALPPTRGDQKETILAALEHLSAGGSTNGGAGIRLAYKVARDHFKRGGINRVILATDGDFNVGITSMGDLERLIEEERKSGVFLTVLGVGTGNVKDSTMERLADRGNGNYAYLDSLAEARKVLVAQAGATLVTIAKDVKIQVEWNPAKVQAYRLIGYENRMLRAEDFKDDKKDAGDMGAGHSVTALYEVVPLGAPADVGSVDPLKYQTPAAPKAAPHGELLTVKLRYKDPAGDVSRPLEIPLAEPAKIGEPAGDFRFASAVAAFGMLLRDSPHKGHASYALVRKLAEESRGPDKDGYRAELLRLVRAAEDLSPNAKIAR